MNKIDPKKVSQEIVFFLKKTFAGEKFSKAVIGLSGGIDSSVSLALTVKALGADNVYPLILPYGDLNKQAEKDAETVADFFKIPENNILKINIKKTVDEIISFDPDLNQVRKGNIMARVRMTFIFDRAKKIKALVVGTENKTEHLLGYFTRFGDEASDIEPLRNLYKTHVYQLAELLNVPSVILNKQPAAGLWEGQTDEKEFGFRYKEADEIFYRLYDQKEKPENIISQGFNKSVVEKVTGFVNKNKFKHHLPYLK